MVAVIVDDDDAADFADASEAPVDPLERLQRAADDVLADIHFDGDGDGGERVLHVVFAQHR